MPNKHQPYVGLAVCPPGVQESRETIRFYLYNHPILAIEDQFVVMLACINKEIEIRADQMLNRILYGTSNPGGKGPEPHPLDQYRPYWWGSAGPHKICPDEPTYNPRKGNRHAST